MIIISLLGSQPTIAEITRMGIAEEICSDYQTLGILVGIGLPQVESYRQQSFMNTTHTCYLILDKWISKNGHPPQYPLTWKGLYNILCDMQYNKVAEKLKVELSTRGINL